MKSVLNLRSERHLEKTPIGYIQWRFQDGHDRMCSQKLKLFASVSFNFVMSTGELLEKATRVLTDEEKALLDQDWVGKNGTKRKLEVSAKLPDRSVALADPRNYNKLIMGRQKLKKTFQYEVKWRGLDHKFNTWVPRDELMTKGFGKLVQQFDDLESSREGAGTRDTSALLVRKHLEDIGLDGDIAQYNEISGLSGG